MKRKLQVIISTSAASVLALSALAQITPAPNKDGPEYQEGRTQHAQRADRLNGAAKASDLIGMTINNYQNEKLGKVEDLAVDVESGRVVQVIVSTGGFIGIGDTLSAVPPSAFHHDVAQKVLHLEANKEKLQNAPKFEMSKWADYSDSNHLAQVYSHYGQESTLGFIQGDAAQDGQRNTESSPYTTRQADGTWNDGQRNTESSPYTISTRQADGTWNKDNVSNDGQRYTAGAPNTVSTRQADGTWNDGQRNTNSSLNTASTRQANGTWNDGQRNTNSSFNTASTRQADGTWNDGQRNTNSSLNTASTRQANGTWNDGQRNTNSSINTASTRQANGTWNDGQRNTDNFPNTVSTRKADGTWDQDSVASNGQNQWMIPAARLGQVQKASKLIGTTVNNLQDDKLGKVEDFLVDLSSGRVVAIIVSSGGFLGLGDELSAVPPTALRFNTDRDTLQLDASKEMLSSAPHFKANQWPDFAQPTYAESVYRAYKVEPYFTSTPSAERDNTVQYIRERNDNTVAPSDQDNNKADATQPDNTARNVRDRNDNTLTPLDQGNSKADVSTTAQIRKEIVAGKNMSVNAKNVKVITKDGHVTLRGPVNSAEEKRLIGEIANRIARSENVNNQLEVKVTTTTGN